MEKWVLKKSFSDLFEEKNNRKPGTNNINVSDWDSRITSSSSFGLKEKERGGKRRGNWTKVDFSSQTCWSLKMEERNRKVWSHWGGIAATTGAGGVHTFGGVTPHRCGAPAHTCHYLQHQDRGERAQPWNQRAFSCFCLSQEKNGLQHVKAHRSAKPEKAFVGMIVSTDRTHQLFGDLTLTPEDRWGSSHNSGGESWLSFLKTSVQPPSTINKPIRIVDKEQEFVHSCCWVCGCQEMKPGARDALAVQSTQSCSFHLDKI